MTAKHYDYFDFTTTQYFFVSEGQKNKILKSVVFTPLADNICNVGFGDWHNGDIDDAVISNNHDIVKIFNTIAKIMYDYSDKFPDQILFIDPVDGKRKQLYNRIFQRHYEDIDIRFEIIGIIHDIEAIKDIEEVYSLKKIYDKFKLKRKFVQ